MLAYTLESLSAKQYAIISIASVAIYISTVVIYRLLFHPLAQYPGPILAKITNLYSAYHAVLGDIHYNQYECHKKYGSIVRYGPNKLIVNTDTALKDVHGFSKNMRKSESYRTIGANNAGPFSVHSVIDKLDHGRKRRIMSQGFSDASLRAYEPLVVERVDTLCRKLGERSAEDEWSHTFNMADWFNYLTFDIIAKLAWGVPFGMLESTDRHSIPEALDFHAAQASFRFQTPFFLTKAGELLRPYILRVIFGNKGVAATKLFFSTVQEMMDRRVSKKDEGGQKDIFSFVSEARDPETGQGFSSAELFAESRVLLLAGSDTSSTALAATFYYLNKNQACLTKLRAELNQFTTIDELVYANLSSLPYLRACIDEAMRMSPPAAGAFYRAVLNDGILLENKYHIPAGVDIGVPIYAIHHNEEYYPEPFKYRPERWLSNDDTGSTTLAKKAFCPFQIGPRGCVGKSLAYMELTLTVAKIVFQYDYEMVEDDRLSKVEKVWSGGEKVYKTTDQFTSYKTGPMLRFKARS